MVGRRVGSGGNSTSSSGEGILHRLSLEDSVYLVVDVMLPLLKATHEVEMVHRDVKPSVSGCFVDGL